MSSAASSSSASSQPQSDTSIHQAVFPSDPRLPAKSIPKEWFVSPILNRHAKSQPLATIQRLIFLGDSLSDRGTIKQRKLFRFIPMDALSGLKYKTITNRFTNGLNWIDYLAKTFLSGRTQRERDWVMSQGGPPPFDYEDDLEVPLALTYEDHIPADSHGWKDEEFMHTYTEGGLTSAVYHEGIELNIKFQKSVKSVKNYATEKILSTLPQKREMLIQRYEQRLRALQASKKAAQEHERTLLHKASRSEAEEKELAKVAKEILGAQEEIERSAKDKILIVEWSGANDLITLWHGSAIPSTEIVDKAVEARVRNIKDLCVKGGFRNFLLLTLPDLSYTPRYRTRDESFWQQMQNLCTYFNHQLSQKLTDLAKDLSAFKVTLKLYDVNPMFVGAYDHDGQFEQELRTKTFVDDAKDKRIGFQHGSRYMFWDDVHPGTEVHKILADDFYFFLRANYAFGFPDKFGENHPKLADKREGKSEHST